MKKYIIIFCLMLGAGALFYSCSEDSISDNSVIKETVNEPTAFDLWLEENYADPYNIVFKYKYEDIEANLAYNLVPATTEHSIMLAKLVKYLWLEPYEEVAGSSFVRTNVPRLMMVIGTVAYKSNNTFTLGTAEGGLKVTLYAGNWIEDYIFLDGNDELTINVSQLNHYYMRTIHHEFAHILHQTIEYPQSFKLISTENYAGSTWNNRSESEAAALGFVSPYAGSEFNEDFVETLARYLTYSEDEWTALLTMAGDTGTPIIEQKLEIVKLYMRETWNIDVDTLREVLARRYSELYDIDWFEL